MPLTHEQDTEAAELLDSLSGEGWDDEVNRLYGLLREAQTPVPVLADPEQWQAAVHEGGKRFGWPWLQYQMDVLAVFDRLGLEREKFRNLAVQVALVLAEKVEAARSAEPPLLDADEANRREARPGAPHVLCGPFFPSGKCMVCGSKPVPVVA